MPRRGPGEGSIFRRKDGRWCAVMTVGCEPGVKQRRLYFYGRTQAEVRKKLTEALSQRDWGIVREPREQTLGEFLNRWMESVVQHNVRPTTYSNYQYVLRHVSRLGKLKLSKLTPQHIQMLYRELRSTGLGRTIVVLHAILHKALDQAVKWGLVPRNITDAVETPKIEKKEFRALTPEEAFRFLRAASEDRLYALYVLAITCGLRLGELLGLRWQDVDVERGTLTVIHQLQTVNGKPVLQPPKTGRSRRTIVLPAVAIKALREHRARQLEERRNMGEVWQDWGLVFGSEIGTPLNESNVRNRSFYPLLQKAGLPRIRFHDLRHTCATLLLAQGIHPRIVQE